MQWEYFTHCIDMGGIGNMDKVNAGSLSEVLNWYGAQNWEFSSTFTTIVDGYTHQVAFVFKRPRAVPPSGDAVRDAGPTPPKGGTTYNH